MRRLGGHLAVAAGAIGVLVLFGGRAASEPAEASPTPTATPAPTPTPVPDPTPTPRWWTPPPEDEREYIPSDVPSWPFEWMEDFENEGEPTETPPPGSGDPEEGPDAQILQEAGGGDLGSGSASGGSRTSGDGGASSSDADAQAAEEDAASGEPAGSPSPDPSAPSSSPSATISESSTTQKQCQPSTIQSSIHDDQGAILQTVVFGSDCSVGASQVLFSYDIRGPPTAVLLVDSVGMSIDVEAHVSPNNVSLHVGYLAPRDATVLSFDPQPAGQPSGGVQPLGSSSPMGAEPLGPLGTGVADADQTGDNRVNVSQQIIGESGDALSGAQTIRLYVEGDAQDVHVGAMNIAPGASASTGNASVSNSNTTHAGPSATGDGTAIAGQRGNNDVTVEQTALARSGDAIAGSQDISVTVTGSVGTLSLDADNLAPGAVAYTGHATATNQAGVSAGPSATSTGDGAALSGQVGDNDIEVDQRASARSGDALAGTQRIAVTVGGSVGVFALGAFNWSADALAVSGDATAANAASVRAGPAAASPQGLAMAGQIGDNRVSVRQAVWAESGTAAAGAQLITIEIGGTVGVSSVNLDNHSPDGVAGSGNVSASNMAGVTAGPQASGAQVANTNQTGSSTASAEQDMAATSGDAVAGGQVVGTVGGWSTGPAADGGDASRAAELPSA